MPTANWDRVDVLDLEKAGVPIGVYRAEVVGIADRYTRKDHDEYWEVRWRVVDGFYAGRLVRDRLFFSGKAMPRFKFLLGALGIQTHGNMAIEHHHLVGRKAYIQVETEEYEWPKGSGKMREKAFVSWAGYGVDPDQDAAPAVAATEPVYNEPQQSADGNLPPVSADDIKW